MPNALKAIVLVAGLILTTCALANQYPSQTYWQGPVPGQWSYPPPNQSQTGKPPSGQRLNSPYGTTWPSQKRPTYQSPNYYNTNKEKPYIETKLSTNKPHVQQGVLLRLSVISQNNLLTATPQAPQIDNFIFQLIEGPVTYSRTSKGKRQIVNDFYYEVIPLRPGRHRIPAITVSGNEQIVGYQRSNRAFEVTTPSNLNVTVREANPATKPWLPLEQLTLKIELSKDLKPAAGRPLPLTTELTAIGISGNKLPGLEQQLNTEAFRVYRDKNQTTTYINKRTNQIIGRRIETFTLVPQFGGDLQLPELSVNWWNTRSESPQRASVPLQPIAVSGVRKETGLFAADEETSLFPSGTPSAFWIPLAVAFGIIFGYWLAVWLNHRRQGGDQSSPLEPLVAFLQSPMRRMAPAFSPLKDKLRTTTAILNPVTRWHRWRRRLVGALPLSVRFWFCVRFVDEEDDPEVWGYTLRFLANKHLGLPPNAPYSVIGKYILDFHPKADSEKIKKLIQELEQTIYGHSQLDFDQWKEAFKHEIRPSLKLWKPTKSGNREQGLRKNILPNLNPSQATNP
jgi:hypothetical protein